ncbi:MAG: type II toxin-antitoxin system VapC family toxin [Leptolyngbyaceae cyanobacterium SL_7_1]|nr:type II toxin-antitoxin system VapC family toxin [Leptolyngbyaceae cyanobacterium SM1_4_3]NJN88694.1 type II toxin-antitoxin system VapC family toxin [Leptolyngbyaceae cyanobacterium SL_7_1]
MFPLLNGRSLSCPTRQALIFQRLNLTEANCFRLVNWSYAEQTAQIRAALKSQGQPIGAYDVLIAATALQHNLIMVTANQREFDRIPSLQTENWRQS